MKVKISKDMADIVVDMLKNREAIGYYETHVRFYHANHNTSFGKFVEIELPDPPELAEFEGWVCAVMRDTACSPTSRVYCHRDKEILNCRKVKFREVRE